MQKCFICGREYDDINRQVAVHAVIDGKECTISAIEDDRSGCILALCRYCVRAAVTGISLYDHGKNIIVDGVGYEKTTSRYSFEIKGCLGGNLLFLHKKRSGHA